MLIEKGHTDELLEEVQCVCAVLILCIYNGCVGGMVNIYVMAPGYRMVYCWLSVVLAEVALQMYCTPHAAQSAFGN